MGKQGKTLVVGVMVLAMGVGGVGSMMVGPPAQTERREHRGPSDVEALAILPLADEDATEAFGAELAAQLVLPNPEMDFGAIVAVDQFVIRGLATEVDLEQLAFFVRDISGIRGRLPQFTEQIYARVRGGDRLKHMGTVERDGHSVARFRLVMADKEGGVEFYDLLVGLRGDRPVIVDYFSLSLSQWQSELYAEGLGGPDAWASPELTPLGNAVRDGHYEEVLRLYDALPEAAQSLRSLWGVRIAAAAETDDVERQILILDEYAARFPNDPAAHMHLLDAHLERGQWAEASADVDALDGAFPDPFWNGRRASIADRQGEYALALELAEGLIRADSTLIAGPDVGLSVTLRTGDLERAYAFAAILRDDFDVDLSVLAEQPGYEALAELPAFAQP